MSPYFLRTGVQRVLEVEADSAVTVLKELVLTAHSTVIKPA